MAKTIKHEIIHYKDQTFYLYLREGKNIYYVDISKKASKDFSSFGSTKWGNGVRTKFKGKALLAYRRIASELKKKGDYSGLTWQYR
jgi:hypothetical protein